MFIELLNKSILNVIFIQDIKVISHYLVYILTNGIEIKEAYETKELAQNKYNEVKAILLTNINMGSGDGGSIDYSKVMLKSTYDSENKQTDIFKYVDTLIGDVGSILDKINRIII